MILRIIFSIFLSILTNSVFAYHSATDTTTDFTSQKLYIGAFGGIGSYSNINSSQFGTAYFTEAEGGPLAINAFGTLTGKSPAFFGAHFGYRLQEVFLGSNLWSLGPTAELEGYHINKKTFSGNLSNNTDRLPERTFMVAYPMRSNVFLINAILSLKHSNFAFLPYIGLGIGSAIVSISNASSTQVNPAEGGINYYNSDSTDTTSTFAGQLKLGISYDINKYLSVFAEYRWLYLASTSFAFGSTVYATHVPTSSWQVKLGSQRCNLGNIGIRVNF